MVHELAVAGRDAGAGGRGGPTVCRLQRLARRRHVSLHPSRGKR